MPAKTPFWTCGKCGFENKPHAFRQGDQTKCEQCGSPSSHEFAADRRP